MLFMPDFLDLAISSHTQRVELLTEGSSFLCGVYTAKVVGVLCPQAPGA
jgi:hypothetical protein